MSELRIVKVKIEDREDGGCSVSSDELPGLILSGRDKTKIIVAVEPAVRALLEAKGEKVDRLRVDAEYSGLTLLAHNQC